VNGLAMTIGGVVKEGRVVPDSPLPEGTRVEIVLPDTAPSVSPELQAEFEAWDRASADALELVERLAREGEADDAR
jgi:hypothetical protein